MQTDCGAMNTETCVVLGFAWIRVHLHRRHINIYF